MPLLLDDYTDLSYVELGEREYEGLLRGLLLTQQKGKFETTPPHAQFRALRLRQRGTYPPSPLPVERDICLLRLLTAVISYKGEYAICVWYACTVPCVCVLLSLGLDIREKSAVPKSKSPIFSTCTFA